MKIEPKIEFLNQWKHWKFKGKTKCAGIVFIDFHLHFWSGYGGKNSFMIWMDITLLNFRLFFRLYKGSPELLKEVEEKS